MIDVYPDSENGIVRSNLFPIPIATDTLGSQAFADQLSGLFHVMCLGQAGHINTGFLGAGQIDRFGNLNDTCVGDYRKPIHRWPGSGGGNDIMSSCARTIVILEQDKRRFLEKVDFVTCRFLKASMGVCLILFAITSRNTIRGCGCGFIGAPARA